MLKLIFNNGREDFVNNTTPSIIRYGTLPTVSAQDTSPNTIVPEDNTVITPPPVVTGDNTVATSQF